MICPILYHDQDLVACIKPVGLSSEAETPQLLRKQLGTDRVWCVHRLDTAVGGVMVFALSPRAAAALSSQIAGRRFEKEYLAAVAGHPPEDASVLRDLLFHDRRNNKSYTVKRIRAGVREAELSYELMETTADLSLLRVRLLTGRSHQIRVQFASRGMPLVGDRKYGSTYQSCPIALWSHALRFTHPFSEKNLVFSSLPDITFPWNSFHWVQTEEEHEIF